VAGGGAGVRIGRSADTDAARSTRGISEVRTFFFANHTTQADELDPLGPWPVYVFFCAVPILSSQGE
jgi:hypothetical protein